MIDDSSPSDPVNDRNQLSHLCGVKNALYTARAEIREGRLVLLGWAHRSGLRQIVDDQVHKVNLVRAKGLAVEKPIEGTFCRFSI
jgi:hypothetical protein